VPDGSDYHTEMNAKIFEKWVMEQLEPVLPPKSLVVMDNASYHSVREEGTKAPTPNSLKGDMINWIEKKRFITTFEISSLIPSSFPHFNTMLFFT
jgi:hypothetical protein